MGPRITRHGFALLAVALLLTVAFFSPTVPKVRASPVNIVAQFTSTAIPINGVVQASQWTAPAVNIEDAGMTGVFEQNSTGLFFLLKWQTSASYCADKYCFGGMEMNNLTNTGHMGQSNAPSIMVLLSPSLTNTYDEFVSEGEAVPTSVETDGYTTQSTCALTVSGTSYTAECYRPFVLSNAAPFDPFYTLVQGSPIELGFAVGELNEPGTHNATDMSSYTLTLSTPPPSSTTSSTGKTSTTSTTSTSSKASSATTASGASSTTTSTTSSASTPPSSTSTSSTSVTSLTASQITTATSVATSLVTTTVSSTVTSISTVTTSTVSVAVSTQIQTAQSVPSWTYVMMFLFLVIGLLAGTIQEQERARAKRKKTTS